MSDVHPRRFVVTVTSSACRFDQLHGNYRQVVRAHDGRLHSQSLGAAWISRRRRREPEKCDFFGDIGPARQSDQSARLWQAVSVGPVAALSVTDLQASPSEEACIHRPHAGAEQGKGGAQSSNDQAVPAIRRRSECVPERAQSQKRAGDRRPQTDDEERAKSHERQVQQRRHEIRIAEQCIESEDVCGDSRHETDEQKPHPGRALGEIRVQPAHSLVRL